jgi:Skp family chaperone for outer membrane proteins
VTAASVEKVNGTPKTSPEPRRVPPAQAEAEAIRKRADAEAEALRIKAEGEADAERALAAEKAEQLRLENEKQALANERAALRFRREEAEQLAKIEEAEAKREATERARETARLKAEADQHAEEQQTKNVEKADKKWRGWAISFYALCAAVALPVQISAFWNPAKPWMAGAPVLLEIAALVVAFGTAAAVANQRPHWHFRLITWVLAFIAASVNFGHGITEFDLATAIGTALASIFGPGVWDLHEHGRIRKRDGVLTRRERKAAEKAAKAEATQKAAEEARRQAEKEAAEKSAEEARAQLAKDREENFRKVWDHAKKLAAALGETTVTEAVWKRAHRDIEGTDPGGSVDVITGRRMAEKRVEAALTGTPVSTLSKTTNAQRASQMPPTRKRRVYNPPARPGRRRKGDTAPYVAAARKQAAITAKSATEKKD